MAYTFDPAVKAALQAALPNQALTDADYHWWTNNGGVAAIQQSFPTRSTTTATPVTRNVPTMTTAPTTSGIGANSNSTMTTLSPGVMGFLGVSPDQQQQAQQLVSAGVGSLNNANRLDYVSPEQRAILQNAANQGLTFLNGDALVPGGPGTQNQNTATFYNPTSGTFGGVQTEDRSNTFWNQLAQQSQQQFNQNQTLGNSLINNVGGNMPSLGGGIGGMISGMQSQNMPSVNIPGMAEVPRFNMPTQPSFNPNEYQANPYLAQMGNSITSQVTENLQRNIMPSLRSGVQAAGGFGGSRQGVLEANALKDANKNISDSLTGMYFGDYTNAMNRNLQRYGMDQNFNMGLGQLGLNARNQAQNYNLGVGQLALGNQNSQQNYNLGLGQLALGNQNSLQNFYSTNRGQDLQQTQLGASLLNMGNTGMLSQGQGLYGLGQTQQQAPWNVVNAGNAGFGQWSGYGTTTSANQGGGLQGALGGAMAGGQLGNLWGNTGSTSLVGMRPTLESYYGY